MNWKWWLKDIKQDKDVKVFSTFSCGGGSTMGYKRAGFQMLGNVEIDRAIAMMYNKNHHPKYTFNMDLREFNKKDNLPPELYELDILDGSPPCTVFSMAGKREDSWGVKKKFREGQQVQTLDDLFFVFLDTVEKLNPKIVVAENVKGMLQGNARGYVKQIIARFEELGYEVQIFLLNAALMDVPQKRERVFFIANRCGFPKLELKFNGTPIKFGEVRSEHGKEITEGTKTKERLKYMKPGDRNMSKIIERTIRKENSCFNMTFLADDRVAPTIASGGCYIRTCDKTYTTDEDIINVGTFPQDYDFCGNSVQYVCGMSVPPNMMAHIAMEIWKQWLSRS